MVFARNFGRIVRECREKKGWTIRETAERCGMSSKGYELIELGDSDPKLSNILSIGRVFDLDLGILNTCIPNEREPALAARQ